MKGDFKIRFHIINTPVDSFLTRNPWSINLGKKIIIPLGLIPYGELVIPPIVKNIGSLFFQLRVCQVIRPIENLFLKNRSDKVESVLTGQY